MKTAAKTITHTDCGTAKQRLLSVKGDPFLFADWERVVFLHYAVPSHLLQPEVLKPFELELHRGEACVSLVALTMRHLRPCRFGSAAWLLRPVARQRFLNVRTYVRCGNEPGALFLWGWLSRPFGLPLPAGMFDLPYAFASMDYEHHYEMGKLEGTVTAGSHRFAYGAAIEPQLPFQPCPSGSLAEFAMERCSGFFCRGLEPRVFRAWHPPWLQTPIEIKIEDDSLLTSKFSWFKEARLAAATFAPGFQGVSIGWPHRLAADGRNLTQRKVLSAFYEMP